MDNSFCALQFTICDRVYDLYSKSGFCYHLVYQWLYCWFLEVVSRIDFSSEVQWQWILSVFF